MKPLSNTESDEPLVSVIIIFLNEEKFLEDAVQSVIAQTYRNWEVLLVDDGSQDCSSMIALTYARQCSGKIRYLHHDGHRNRGMSASRNLGIANAEGEYIAMLDADDVWFPNKLKEQVAVLKSHPEAAMVYGATQYWYSWTGNPRDARRDFVPKLRIQGETLIKPPTLLVLYLKGKATVPCLSSDMLLRRAILEDIGGFEETFTGLYEDQAFLAKLCLKGSVFVASRCWDRYRLHPNSCCSISQKLKHGRAMRLFYFDWLASYLSARGIDNEEIWAALKNERWFCQHPFLSCITPKHLARCSVQPLRFMIQWILSLPLTSQITTR